MCRYDVRICHFLISLLTWQSRAQLQLFHVNTHFYLFIVIKRSILWLLFDSEYFKLAIIFHFGQLICISSQSKYARSRPC
jgi:hypothetical protein